MYRNKVIGVVIPAFNEAASIGLVVRSVQALRDQGKPLVDHIVVCDNASTDATAEIAAAAGAIVVHESQQGYGAACLAAIAALPACDAVCFIDGDHSVKVAELTSLLACWHSGAQLVIGSRTLGDMQAGALTPQQRWGNHLASFLLSRIWHQPVTDLGPFRVIDRAALQRLHMMDTAFGWTVEMQAKALMLGMSTAEIPVSSVCRIGQSKISGTLRGTIGAAWGILSTIAKCWWQTRHVATPLTSRGT